MNKNPYLLAEEISSESKHEYWSLRELNTAKGILIKRIEELHAEYVNSRDTHPTGVTIHSLKLMYEALWKVNHQHHGIATYQFSKRKPLNDL